LNALLSGPAGGRPFPATTPTTAVSPGVRCASRTVIPLRTERIIFELIAPACFGRPSLALTGGGGAARRVATFAPERDDNAAALMRGSVRRSCSATDATQAYRLGGVRSAASPCHPGDSTIVPAGAENGRCRRVALAVRRGHHHAMRRTTGPSTGRRAVASSLLASPSRSRPPSS